MQGPTMYIAQRRKSLEVLRGRMDSLQSRCLYGHRQRFMSLAAKLDAMSPLKVLVRGYSLSTAQDGTVIRSITQTKAGQEIGVRLADGTLTALITDVKEI